MPKRSLRFEAVAQDDLRDDLPQENIVAYHEFPERHQSLSEYHKRVGHRMAVLDDARRIAPELGVPLDTVFTTLGQTGEHTFGDKIEDHTMRLGPAPFLFLNYLRGLPEMWRQPKGRRRRGLPRVLYLVHRQGTELDSRTGSSAAG